MVKEYEENEMSENGNGFSFGDALLTQAMTGFGGNNRGGGYGGGGGGSWFGGGGCGVPGSPFADLATIQHGLDCNRDIYSAGNQAVLSNQENLQRNDSFNRVCDKIGEQNNVNGQNMLNLTGTMAHSSAAVQQGFSTVLLEMCKCCKDGEITAIKEGCQTRELIVSENTKTRELFLSTKLQEAVDQNNITATVGGINAQSNANTQAIIQAIQGMGNGHHGSH